MRTAIGILVLAGTCALALDAGAASPKKAVAADSVSAVRARTPAPSLRKEAVRTLEAIHIEGEIAVPQVLFITARDYRRFRDGLGAKYQASPLAVARPAGAPSRLRTVAANESNKEEGQ